MDKNMVRKIWLPFMFSQMPAFQNQITDDLAGIDIEKEFELIRQKKSRLSRRLRDAVVYRHAKGE